MERERLISKSSGFGSVEALLAASIFGLLVTAFIGAYFYGQESTALSGNRARALMLAEEGLEATRNIRDSNFTNLSDGTYGITTVGNQYNLSGTNDTTDIFTRSVNITTAGTDRKNITSTVTWQQNPTRTGSVTLNSYLTYWQKTILTTCVNQANFLTVNTSGAILTNANRRLSGITIGNSATNCGIVIDKISLTWTTSARRLVQIDINGGSVWAGSVSSGTVNDITDYTLTGLANNIPTLYYFSGNVNNNIFNITYTMSDGTIKTVSGVTP